MDPSTRPPVAPWTTLAASQWPPVTAALTNHQFLYSYTQSSPEVRRSNRELLQIHSKPTEFQGVLSSEGNPHQFF